MGNNIQDSFACDNHWQRRRGSRRLCASVSIALALTAVLAGGSSARASGIITGDDFWVTPVGGTWDAHTLPAGFFGPGSDPFDEVIRFQGSPLTTNNGSVFPADTVVRRQGTGTFDCPGSATVPIELVALSLVSINPITVTYNGGLSSDQWNVQVCKSPMLPNPTGSMTITHTCANGGTYSSTLPVHAHITFTRTTGGAGSPLFIEPTLTFTSSGWWSHTDPGFGLSVAPFGTSVDTDCDGIADKAVASTPGPPDGFFPGLYSTDCSNCGTGHFKKPMSPEEEQLAAHGVFVANREKPQIVGACCLLNPPGTCLMTGPECQTQFNGDFWVGPWTQCTPNPCFSGGVVCGDGFCDGAQGESKCTCVLDCGPPPMTETGLCTDGIDNDCDGCTDTADSDCGGTETSCTDGADNDCDGKIDCADSDCTADPACAPPPCQPNSTGTGCSQVTCPVGPGGLTQTCEPKCALVNPLTGAVSVTVCGCTDPADCHIYGNFTGGAVVASGPPNACVVPDNGGGTVNLPPPGCGYLSPDDVHMIINGLPVTNPPTTIHVAVEHKSFFCQICNGGPNNGLGCKTDAECTPGTCGIQNPVCSFGGGTPGGVICDEPGGTLGGEEECSHSKLELTMTGTGNLAGFNRTISLRSAFETHTAPRIPGDPVQSFDTEMFRLQGQLPPGDPDFDLLRITAGNNFGMPSPGHTTLTQLPGGNWAVDSFFDITYRIDFIGKPGGSLGGMSGSTTATIRMSTGAPTTCQGACPAGTVCNETRTVNANGTITVCCDCVPPPCEPNAAGTGCTACPDPTKKCVPTHVFCIPGTTTCSVVECNCFDAAPCHVELNAAGQPFCVNPCLDPTATCRLINPISTPELFFCECEPPPPDPVCEPNAIGTGCNPITCLPNGTPVPDKCQPKCALLDPLTGQMTLSDCNCVGENECHMLLSNGAGGAGGAVAAGPGVGIPPECVVPDNGSGTITLPPAGCEYLSPDQFHQIVDGLPPGVTIEIAAIHRDFACGGRNGTAGVCTPPIPGVDCVDEGGGTLGGDSECSESKLVLNMRGNLGGPSTFEALKTLPVSFETYTAARTPGNPVQSFDTEMFKLQGQLPPGDPDFDLLRITAGNGFGMPSPGHTTLTAMGQPGPGTNWAVDSFFDIEYRIDFVGKAGGPLGGMSGSTTATIRMATKRYKCVGDCPTGTVCHETRTPFGAQEKICCECLPTVCEPNTDRSGCTNAGCNCFGECTSFGGYCDSPDPACCLQPGNCMCYERNAQESIKRCPGCFGSCVGGSYCDGPDPTCWLNPAGAACYIPSSKESILLCGDCFGRCVNGSYCDGTNPSCCIDPGNCQCYAPTNPISIKLCAGVDTCKPKCVKYNQATGLVKVETCDCIGSECYATFPFANVIASPGAACEVVDNGSGSVDLPPVGCDYLSPDQVHKIIDGLPAGTEIHLAPIHKDFICHEGTQSVCDPFVPPVICDNGAQRASGGALGGERECSNSTLEFQLTGTGTLAGWNRIVTIPNTTFETHTGLKKPGAPVQSFPTEMYKLQGQLPPGDPDFDLLRITAGNGFGLPSPGHTTLTQLPGGKWAVDSFFDIEYRIDFIGAPLGRIGPRSGSTTATIRMQTNPPFKCTNTCPPGKTCVQTTTQPSPPDGTMNICCDCVDAPACAPKPDGLSCSNNTCPPGVICKPKRIQCTGTPPVCKIVECDCLDGDPCHVEMLSAPCSCNADVDGSNTINSSDVTAVSDCANLGACSRCVNSCDVNCDGDINQLDINAVRCQVLGGGTECCGAAVPPCTGGCPAQPPTTSLCRSKSVSLPGGGTEYSCECFPLANTIVWNPATIPGPWPNTNPEATTRSLRFTVTGPGTPSKVDALKVTMVDLQHPNPRNSPTSPPANYTTFDTRSNGVCSGGQFNGHHCDTDADCVGTTNGTCTPLAACTAAGEGNGCARWVGKPGTFYESEGPPQSGPYLAARLQCTPFYWDWKSEGLITVVGAEIVPSSEYSVQDYAETCMGGEGTCTNVSAAVTMYTRRSGDVDVPYNPGSLPTTNQPNATDIAQLVNKFKNLLGAPVHARAQLQPNLPELNASINALDIVAVVDAFKGLPYAFSGPCPCPSTVMCGGVCGASCAGMCVKTCTGGTNAGDPCIGPAHCPGGACSATGTCRDKCGRCTP